MSQGEDHLLSSIQESAGLSAIVNNKKQGVSGQSLAVSRDVNIPRHNKDFRSRTIIKEAIMENDFLKNLSQGQVLPSSCRASQTRNLCVYICLKYELRGEGVREGGREGWKHLVSPRLLVIASPCLAAPQLGKF